MFLLGFVRGTHELNTSFSQICIYVRIPYDVLTDMSQLLKITDPTYLFVSSLQHYSLLRITLKLQLSRLSLLDLICSRKYVGLSDWF